LTRYDSAFLHRATGVNASTVSLLGPTGTQDMAIITTAIIQDARFELFTGNSGTFFLRTAQVDAFAVRHLGHVLTAQPAIIHVTAAIFVQAAFEENAGGVGAIFIGAGVRDAVLKDLVCPALALVPTSGRLRTIPL
jgi:hypothetical protein